MIFVTVGTGSTYGFERLIISMDDIANRIDEKVIMQIGCAKYRPKYASYFYFIPRSENEEYIKNSRLTIAHAAAGSILMAFHYNIELILVPRDRFYNECIDNHQMDMARQLEKEGIKVIYDINNLMNAIVLKNNYNQKSYATHKDLFIQNLKLYLCDLDNKLKIRR